MWRLWVQTLVWPTPFSTFFPPKMISFLQCIIFVRISYSEWPLAFEKKPFQFRREIWIQVVVITAVLNLMSLNWDCTVPDILYLFKSWLAKRVILHLLVLFPGSFRERIFFCVCGERVKNHFKTSEDCVLRKEKCTVAATESS